MKNIKRKILKWIGVSFLLFLAAIVAFIIWFYFAATINPPFIKDKSALKLKRECVGKDMYQVKDSWLKKNDYGLWEMKVCGNDFEMGVKNGMLTKELNRYQEQAFVERINELVPSKNYLNFLKYFIAFFNRNIDDNIPLEYRKEIYGVSLFASPEFNYIAPNYHRMINYHGAHDIGHTLQNMSLVGCTAFGVKNTRSEDSSLLIGRNMDFYSGDKFAENKIIVFCKPKNGYKFAYVSWAGLIGVISGMNDQGLTVTLNAAKSPIPTSAKTPVSILARIILQHASNINEAYALAQKYQTFVAESFMIGSAKDNDIAIIEKTTDDIDLYRVKSDEIILTNHYQGKKFKDTEINRESITDYSTMYRWHRTKQLLDKRQKHNVNSFASILRDTKGKDDKDIGLGNEKAVNQLIAHHSVIFKPKQRQIWISTSPYQLGAYLCYDLNKVFSDSLDYKKIIYLPENTIAADNLIKSKQYNNFLISRRFTEILKKINSGKIHKKLSTYTLDKYLSLNPEYFYPYYLVGEYYFKTEQKDIALKYYQQALTKEITTKKELRDIENRIEEIKNKD